MDFWQFINFVVIPSGLFGALTGGVVNYISNKKLDVHKRTMEIRKETYTKVNEILSTLYDTATKEEAAKGKNALLPYSREMQLWGSDEVVRSFRIFLKALDAAQDLSQEERNLRYKEFVIAMRRDLLNKTDLTPDELEITGRIN
ncbi:MAG: hypothetical protein A3B37_00830 [Candidatus Sungbacteria bacterium RIFCSPLOWO2_01_FULL_59_16]|uniref:Uncharacterized protein n=1 Tax=Candidatus Sungbacteria bacterium RIFCSPLOWO2_01_FULL_59_16 TaxID=1802280 RepID=A0A1G2LD01_9BACT|nr:MAG: hypothetical protein A3B37_00830 [Candidatus Sungbacteria bacterium RIFCSPLOWO2_01_FULL_59_16]